MKLQTKNIKHIKSLLGFAIGFSISSIFIYINRLVDIANQTSEVPFMAFCKGFSEGLNIISFLIVVIISALIYKRLDGGSIFSKSIIYYVQLFGLLQIISAIFAGLSVAQGRLFANPHSIIIGILIIIFAQVFRVALRMQQEEELTI